MSAELRKVEYAFTSFHTGAVHGLSTCVRKQLVATCGADKSIRLWNYFTKTTELVKLFTEECFSVALHPSGTLISGGFADKLRLMSILMDDFKLIKEFPVRSCRECRFAHGGHYLAAVGGNTIFIYTTYACEVIATLRGHNGKISSLFWSDDDFKLLSAGLDGAIYEWNVKEQKRERENVLKGCNYSCVIATTDFNNLLAVGSDLKLKELEDIQGGGTQITKDVSANILLTQLAMPSSERLLFAATQNGTIRTYKYPISGDFHEYKCQSGPITRLALTADGSVLVTASQDGTVFVLDVRENDLASKLRREQLALPWAEEVLVSKMELDEKHQRMLDLETKVNEITMQTEYQLRLKDLNLQERIKEESDRHDSELHSERKRFELLSQEKNEMELEYEEKLRSHQERSQQQLNALDSQYQQKILSEVERYQQLLKEKDTLNKRWDEQNALLVEAHETTIQQLTEEYEGRLHEEHLNSERLMTEKDTLEEEFEEIKKQLEEDADREVDELKHRYEKKLLDEREIGLRLKGQNGIMRKKFNTLQSDIEAQKEEIKSLFEEKRELHDTIVTLEKDIQGLKKAVKERDETISDKERRVYDLKKKNQELEKFKFVLDYKIKELKSLIEPKDEEIEEYKDQVKEMDLELQQYHEANAALDLTISNLKLKQNGLIRQVEIERRMRDRAKTQLEILSKELEDVVQHIQHPKLLKHKIIEMYRRRQQRPLAYAINESNVEDEFERQRNYLEKTVESLKLKSARDAKLHRIHTVRTMQENSELIKEINALRKRLQGDHHVADPLPTSDHELTSELSSHKERIAESSPADDITACNVAHMNEQLPDLRQARKIDVSAQDFATSPLHFTIAKDSNLIMSESKGNEKQDEERPPRMLESMGWLTESILIPRKGKAIEGVGAGTLVDLKAQYYLSQEQARLQKESGESVKGRKRKNEDDGMYGTNKGVSERDKKDRLHLKTKEEAEESAYAQLEKKAELYDQLTRGEVPSDEEEQYEVNFFEKRYEHQTKKSKGTDEAPSETDMPEDEARRQRRELVLEQAGLTKKGRERASQIKEARQLMQKQKRAQLKAAFIQRKLAEQRSEKQQASVEGPFK